MTTKADTTMTDEHRLTTSDPVLAARLEQLRSRRAAPPVRHPARRSRITAAVVGAASMVGLVGTMAVSSAHAADPTPAPNPIGVEAPTAVHTPSVLNPAPRPRVLVVVPPTTTHTTRTHGSR